jgi:hypothetical protein
VSTSAWMMLSCTWLLVGSMTIYLIAKVLRTPPRP